MRVWYVGGMDERIGRDARLAGLLAAALDGALTEAQAEGLATIEPALLTLAWLAAAQRIAEQNEALAQRDACIAQLEGRVAVAGACHPFTPSGQRPVYTKPPAPTASGTRRPKKPGAKPGHVGHRRPKPTRIDRREEHRLEVCPCCGGQLTGADAGTRACVHPLLDMSSPAAGGRS